MIRKNTFLITGGTGSFGKSMLNYLLKNDAKEIRILSRDEKKQEQLRLNINNEKVKFIIGDVRDTNSIREYFENVDYVFHAAALKQVPSCEFYPLEAIKTNVLGTENVIKSSIRNKVKSMVLLSTDKSVYPINAMGMTKGLAEKLVIANAKNNKNNFTNLCITRYGNVMGSRGSVIPLFIDQIKKNKTLTITDYNMTRFLMSLDESIDLVIKAFKEGKTGDIFVKKAPAVTIEVLVAALLDIFNSNCNINVIGTRHGEKLFETLVSREEIYRSKETKNYYCIKADARTINYDTYFTKGKKKLSDIKDYNSHNTKRLSIKEAKNILLKMDFVKKEIL